MLFFHQNLGRVSSSSRFEKVGGKKEACAKCGKEHLTRSCTVAKENECCINCKNAGVTNDEDLNHRSSSKICPRYLEEISKIRNNTDHGFQP